MAKTRIRIETGGYNELLDLSIEGLDDGVAQTIVNNILATLQTATSTQAPKETN
jgi:hypothetical protein